MPVFKFINLTGKKILFKVQNEDHDKVESFIDEKDPNFVFTLAAGSAFSDDNSPECKKIRRAVENLL